MPKNEHHGRVFVARLHAGGRGLLITPPEVANTGPGVNRGSGGGARWVYMRVQGGFISYGRFVCLSVCPSVVH